MKEDAYQTIAAASPETLFKDRKSKFYGYAFPITTEEEVKPLIQELRKKHHTANHVCYAWQLGHAPSSYRVNDDGEPNNSAGMPIYGQIQSYGLTNILVAVVRIFGGTKLGVGGLIQAYKASAQMALEASTIIDKVVSSHIQLKFGYEAMDKVMRTMKQKGLAMVSQQMEMNCTLVIAVRNSELEATVHLFKELHNVEVKPLP